MSGRHERQEIGGDLTDPQVREAINRAARARGLATDDDPVLPMRSSKVAADAKTPPP